MDFGIASVAAITVIAYIVGMCVIASGINFRSSRRRSAPQQHATIYPSGDVEKNSIREVFEL